ncbi:hypothetical protein A2333_02410 [Candidatus Wolfebacteria bacterium RIFOXYB2_FULL_49_7]|nr:MAG: hypothetical protein A2333_02410 [Candidatus Wolfebacteria bacterium RIFOXYB2_FULL_49_7]
MLVIFFSFSHADSFSGLFQLFGLLSCAPRVVGVDPRLRGDDRGEDGDDTNSLNLPSLMSICSQPPLGKKACASSMRFFTQANVVQFMVGIVRMNKEIRKMKNGGEGKFLITNF